MKLLNYIMIAGIFFGIFSCRKFKHEAQVPQSCEQCAFADEIDGEYRGLASGNFVEDFTGYTADSMYVSVQHYFKNAGQVVDSSRMFFHVEISFDGAWGDTVYFEKEMISQGKLLAPGISAENNTPSDWIIDPAQLDINETMSNLPVPGTLYNSLFYTGFRIP